MTIRDRGKIKWTAMMLPEHVGQLRRLWNDEFEQEKKPILDEYEVEEIENKVHFAMEFIKPIVIKTWEEGFFKEHKGMVNRLNELTKTIYLEQNNGEIQKILFLDIVGAEITE